MVEKLERMPEDWSRALAVVAHPDDLEYGAASAVAEWTDAGRDIAYLLVTRGEAGIDGLEQGESARVREAEQRASAGVVGVSVVEFLGHRDGVIEDGVGLRRDLTAAIRRHRPEMLITLNHHDTWGGKAWNTPDHRAVGRAALDAAGDAGNRWIFPEQLREGGLEPWGGVRWVAVAGSPQPTHIAEVGTRSQERGIASLSEHRTYLAALDGAEPAEQARSFLTGIMDSVERDHGVRGVAFEVYSR
ncbi:LmbE family N-acetylglucosaminyl deacetylase [Saccharopolyspora erythraea NRRL 2338]|uniref:Uncharacterized protein n=2 Tax=Saccharopolyspora erythraea TaxID=1836 RepID=A4FH24_SACEN|nr:PIG-L family deacetylase [Saccharopolyspora erythraea]EQD82447.1 GlcNAc-PI de-N-acetylase [Saccharopolyspora erythraea D]PFG97052.1 LmbE family N-acetylglucosaminyl deacetylase [Saccharopolyspora erythraea NRRL 2338]QRK87258.1 PIG-L family deacetylase [Saccharopolyspora erythraea]CAM03349.1 hypothetical protein SACE_4078 [Saccharopolyspora erythraea NRRL 2338]